MNINYQTLILKKNEILEELKNAKYNDLGDLVYRMLLTYDEIIDMLDVSYFLSKRTGNSSNLGEKKKTDINRMLE